MDLLFIRQPAFATSLAFGARQLVPALLPKLETISTRQSTPRPCRSPRRRKPPTMNWRPAGLLREAVEIKKVEVQLMEETLTERPDHPVNMRRAFFAPRTNDRFSRALRRSDGSLAVVAALKRFQPRRAPEQSEMITPLEDAGREARVLETCGVDAAMVYTDRMRYGVELADMVRITRGLKTSTQDFGMPVARQDLIIDPVQIAEASEAGACAVTLVAGAALPELMELLNAATAMGVEAVVECHTALERDFAMECGATIVFLTNFDRSRNILVPGTAEKLAAEVPPWVLKLGGGGLCTAAECWKYLDEGFNGVVLGKSLLQSRRPAGFIKEIRSQKRFMGDVFSGEFGRPYEERVDE